MNTLSERLKRSGYTDRLAENERNLGLCENARRDCESIGGELTPEQLRLERAVRTEAAALAAEYEATVKLVDSRTDLEFELLDLQEKLELAAEECHETDPEKAAKIRSIFADHDHD